MEDLYQRPWSVGEAIAQTPVGEMKIIVSYITGEWPDEICQKWRKLSFLSIHMKGEEALGHEDLMSVENEILEALIAEDRGILVARKTFLAAKVRTEFVVYSDTNFDSGALFRTIAEKHPTYICGTAYDIDRFWTIYKGLLEKVGVTTASSL